MPWDSWALCAGWGAKSLHPKIPPQENPSCKIPPQKIPPSKIPPQEIPLSKIFLGKIPTSKIPLDKKPTNELYIQPFELFSVLFLAFELLHRPMNHFPF